MRGSHFIHETRHHLPVVQEGAPQKLEVQHQTAQNIGVIPVSVMRQILVGGVSLTVQSVTVSVSAIAIVGTV